MFTLMLIIHVTVCILLIFFVLLQSGRGADLGAAFGSMGQVTHSRGSMGGIGIITTTVAVIFMLSSLTLAFMSSERARDSVVKDIPIKTETSSPSKAEEALTSSETESNEETSSETMEQTEVLPLEQTEVPPLSESVPVPTESAPAESP